MRKIIQLLQFSHSKKAPVTGFINPFVTEGTLFHGTVAI